MLDQDKLFVEQIEFLLKEFREKNLNMSDLMKFIEMAYGDYKEFNPEKFQDGNIIL